jgi:hypothetical protein
MQGFGPALFSEASLGASINPRSALPLGYAKNPFFIRRGFRPLPKPLANLWQGA